MGRLLRGEVALDGTERLGGVESFAVADRLLVGGEREGVVATRRGLARGGLSRAEIREEGGEARSSLGEASPSTVAASSVSGVGSMPSFAASASIAAAVSTASGFTSSASSPSSSNRARFGITSAASLSTLFSASAAVSKNCMARAEDVERRETRRREPDRPPGTRRRTHLRRASLRTLD